MTWSSRTSTWLWIPTACLALLGACTDEAVLVAADGGASGGTAGSSGSAGAGGSAGSAGSSAGTGGSAGSAGTGGAAGSGGDAGSAGTGGVPPGCAPVKGRDTACDDCMAANCTNELADCERMNDCSCMMWDGQVGQMNCMFQCDNFRPVDTDYEQCYDACGRNGMPSPETVALIECIAEGGGGQPPKCPSCFPMPGN